jgi:2-polyprenyl-3-methyl-5-hydroxy-6-metoxy-1,4-benzoquinol methylase
MGCILCDQSNFKTVSTKDAKSSDFLNVSICQSCGMVQQDPIPTEAELKAYYSTEYRQDYKNTYTPKPKHIFRAGNLALNRLEFLTKNGVTSGKLLDVGAGGGEFTWLSGQMGFESEGMEPNIGYSTYAREEYSINVQTGQLADVIGDYQVITMFHVLEHIPDPVKTFENLWTLLEDRGHVLIEVPNIETNDASPHNIYFKAHIHYFSEATLIASASPYFEVVVSDNSSNLRILFKKRTERQEPVLPSASQIQFTKKRLQRKGWTEYIFAGKGYTKIFSRITTIIREAMLPKQGGIQLLQRLIKDI